MTMWDRPFSRRTQMPKLVIAEALYQHFDGFDGDPSILIFD